ncbi:MAG TPA: glycosyltransferase family 4 protein [Terriglobia bacterium]|nr:glycosyltransferase family 4 protein [Terriglobia bacterium]
MLDKLPAVCIIVENLPVPFDRRVWQEARSLRDAGYRVSVISPRGKGYERNYEVCEGIEIYRHGVWEASGAAGYLLEYSWSLTMEFLLTSRVFLKTQFKILQICNPPDLIFLVAVFFKLFGVRLIFDHHDLNPELYEAKLGRRSGILYTLICWAERLTYKAADVSIATNDSYREIALTRGRMDPRRVFTVRSCPDLKDLRVSPTPALKQGKPYLVVYLGVMGQQEGLGLLLEAIEYIVKERRRKDVCFVMIGDGTEKPYLQARCAAMGLDRVVTFTGKLNSAEYAPYLSTADVCVASDPKNLMNDKSTMNKILDYMAYGRPTVLFELTEGRRSAGDAALYARPNDPMDFAEQILKLLNSEPLRRQLGECGRKRIEGRLNWEMEKVAFLAAYAAASNA